MSTIHEVIGTVADFDEFRGDGVIVNELGESFYFHCVEIADGTRRVPLGARVTGRRMVGHLGADEVGSIRQI